MRIPRGFSTMLASTALLARRQRGGEEAGCRAHRRNHFCALPYLAQPHGVAAAAHGLFGVGAASGALRLHGAAASSARAR
ncbi:MAG: hypothetical protein WKG07_05850 [Hymenobacter sp.]